MGRRRERQDKTRQLTRVRGGGGEVVWVVVVVLLVVVLLLALVLHEAIVEVWRRRSGVRVVLTGIVRPGLGLAILLLLLLMMSSRDRTAGSAGRAGTSI